MNKRRPVDQAQLVVNTSISPRTDAALQRDLARYQLIYSIAGLGLGLTCTIGGMVLFLMGVAGALDWYASMLGFESKITQAAPGAVLFVVGLFVVWITRYKFRHVPVKEA